jgi:pimeloyl-ACP methyl ester carboxylesterase
MKARINGVELYFETRGAAGPPVIVVHSEGRDSHEWDAVVRLLARRCRVTSYDRRGHGHSERTAVTGSIRDDAADLAALIEQLGLAPVHLVGAASGATIALQLVIKRPGLAASAAVHEPNVRSLDVDGLASFGGPLFITHGDQSEATVIGGLDEISDVCPRAQRYIFRRTGHDPHRSQPDDYALVVGSFINGVHVS